MFAAPLNMAHFHDRRADKFLRHNSYDDAYKAVETSLIYLQDAYKYVTIPKAIEVLDTQKWEYERKLGQIVLRKQQHERMKRDHFAEFSDIHHRYRHQPTLKTRVEYNINPQTAAKSIDKTISLVLLEQNMNLSKETKDSKLMKTEGTGLLKQNLTLSEQTMVNDSERAQRDNLDDSDEISLAPLELPSFDFNVFATSASMANVAGLAESFQK